MPKEQWLLLPHTECRFALVSERYKTKKEAEKRPQATGIVDTRT
jgi:hypothetical protein